MSDRTPGAAVLMEDDGLERVLTLHQPDRHNTLDLACRQELGTALRDASRDERCRAVVTTGAGGNLCAGGDIRSMTPVSGESAARTEVVAGIVRAMVRSPKPGLATVEGVAFGLGMSLAASCDHVVAARDARFGCPFGRIGLIADSGLLWSLQARVGLRTAKRLLLFGDVLDSGESAALGSGRRPVRARIRMAGSGTAGRAASRRRSVLHRGDQADPASVRRPVLPAKLDAVLAEEIRAQPQLPAGAGIAEGSTAFSAGRAPRSTGPTTTERA
ncbi:enoyl-CoA hydratase/isomerase family protein [Streptomyces cavernae]|uniref:enoyl-CoA hydratase/isomerase family protein n=1 Tax=Streptomyces cavernae TaxID=2259034 RepID=UPI000FEBCB9C|nr:enoyl-CoA hydratase/isomerase family protein [Streptomyces cavernae]